MATCKPVDVALTPGEAGDMLGFRSLFVDLPEGTSVYTDKGYTDYTLEATLEALGSLHLIAARKSNSKRPHPGHVGYLCQVIRKRAETTFSAIAAHFSRSIHAVTSRGFELKVFLTVLAYSILG